MTDDQAVARLQEQLATITAEIAALSTNGGPPPAPDPAAQREATLALFRDMTGLEDLQAITQRGRDPETARFTMHFAGDVDVRVGTIKILWSRAELSKALAVAIGRVPLPAKPNDWAAAIGALFADVVQVEETPDEAFEDTVREWLHRYADRASTDHQGAAAARQPFTRTDDDAGPQLYVAATDFAKYIRREYSETGIKLPELRQALSDLGYTTTHVSFEHGRGTNKTRSSASYYRGPIVTTPAAE